MNKFFIIILILLGLGCLTPKVDAPDTVHILTPLGPTIIKAEEIKENSILTNIKIFLKKDKTSDMDYGLGPYQCTHFSRDLSSNANKNNIPIGGIILGNDPDLKGYSNHALNYIVIGNIFYIINPDSDFIIPWSEYIHNKAYKYYKLYPDGTQLPSRWSNRGLSNVRPTSDLL